MPTPYGEFENNLLGPNERYKADGQTVYPIPQGGLIRHLDPRWTFGVTLFSAGLGPDYVRSPYARFGAAARSSLTLVSSGANLAIAWKPTQDHALGLAVNPGYQIVTVKGLQFAQNTLPLLRQSETPGKTTNQGADGAFTLGATVGWHGLLAPTLAGGLSYRTKTWSQRHHEYRGLIPDQGRLELPAIWGGGLAWMPVEWATLAFDYQRFEFASEKALGNPISRLSEGKLLGSNDGPGFGLRDQEAYKFGLAWNASPSVTLRMGYIHATRPTQPSETLFNILASMNTTTHYTAGFTWALKGWEISGAYAHAPRNRVEGEGSVPLLFGGGEANHGFGIEAFAISVGWGFGNDAP